MPFLPMVDLFCGAGGLSFGLTRAGFTPVYAIDLDKWACRTYSRNIGPHVESASIIGLTARSIMKKSGLKRGQLALVCGGPPCQGFSTQRRGPRQDERNALVVEFARIAVDLRPALILIENVPGLLGRRGQSEFEALAGILGRSGYRFDASVVDAGDYGVPQNRMRAVVMAWDAGVADALSLPNPSRANRRTVRDAIGKLPEPPLDYTEHPRYANHVRVQMSALNVERISHVPPGGGRLNIPVHLQLQCHRQANGHRHLDVYGRMEWDRPAPTITAMFDNFTRGRFAHPSDDRSITGREGARLQSFPDRFRFEGPKKDVARQIGNAVPPRLSFALGRELVKEL